MKKSVLHRILFITCLFIGLNTQHAADMENYPRTKSKVDYELNNLWEVILLQETDWWRSNEAINLAENVLLYQRKCGGWPKNIDMMKPLTISIKNDLGTYTNEPRATIDNGATWSQMKFLSKLIEQQPEQRYKLAFLKGLDYLLEAQYENGGSYHGLSGFRDGALIGSAQRIVFSHVAKAALSSSTFSE